MFTMNIQTQEALKIAEKFGFIRYKGGIDWASNYDDSLVALINSLAQTAPLQNEFAKTKSWQGLNDDEVARLVIINEVDKSGDTGFAKLIEQALKEKNHVI